MPASNTVICVFLISAFLLAGCIEQSPTNPSIKTLDQILAANTLTINVNDGSTPDKGFFVLCSGGVSCDNPRALRILQYRDQVEYNDQTINFLLFFDPALSSNYSLESFRQNFSRTFRPKVTIKFPEKSDLWYDWSFYSDSSGQIPRVEFQKYENNKLTGQLEFFIDHISRKKKDLRCQVADMAPPSDCGETKPFGKTVIIQFELTVNPAQK